MSSPTNGNHSPKALVLFPSLPFLKCILVVQGDYCLGISDCVYHILIRLVPTLLLLYHSAPLLFYRLQCIVLYYLHTQRQYFNIFLLSNILFPLPFSSSPSERLLIQSWTLSLMYASIYNICIYVYIYLIGLASTYRGEHVHLSYRTSFHI
jgi:hypothetical protein